MSTPRQRAAYREIKAARLRDAQIKAYGMVPFNARHAGKCGCGRIFPAGTHFAGGPSTQDIPCAFRSGDAIVKFRGAWWNAVCVDRVKQDEFRASARFVLVEDLTKRAGQRLVYEKYWTNDPAVADQLRRNACEDERVIDRQQEPTT